MKFSMRRKEGREKRERGEGGRERDGWREERVQEEMGSRKEKRRGQR